MKAHLRVLLSLAFLAACAPAFGQPAGTTITGLPAATALSDTELAPIVQSGVTKKATVAQVKVAYQGTSAPTLPILGQFWFDTTATPALVLKQYDGASWVSIGTLNTTAHTWTPAGGGGAGTVTTTGTPASGNLSKFSGAASITNGDLSGDCTTSGTLAVNCTKTGGVAFAPSATTDTTNAANIGSGTLPAGRLPNPSASTLGGVESLAAATHQFLTSISVAGVPTAAQPAVGDLSGLGTGVGTALGAAVSGSGSICLSTGSSCAPPAAANPTATIGVAAVNGVASTFMRSDAAPPLPSTLPALNGSLLTGMTVSQISGAAPLASPTFTGTVTIPNGGVFGTPTSLTLTNAVGLPLTTGVTGILPAANGGNGNGFFAVSGPATTTKTFTFPNASATVLTTNAAVTVAQGGTGIASGTSGGILYFNSTTSTLSSALLAANALVIGGGAGAAPSTTTTGTGILAFLGTPSSANLAAALTDETGTGAAVFANGPTLIAPVLGTPASGNASNLTNIPVANATGILPAANGGAGSINGILLANGSGLVSGLTVGSGLSLVGSTLSATGSGGNTTITPTTGNVAGNILCMNNTTTTIQDCGYSASAIPSNKLTTAQNAQVGTTYTVVSGDGGKIVSLNNASPVAVTLFSGATAGAGWGADLDPIGAGTVTTTLASGNFDNAQTSIAHVKGQDLFTWSDGTNMHDWLSMPPIANNALLGNTSGHSEYPVSTTLTALIDGSLGSTRGAILERGASGWAILAPSSTAGQALASNGTGADPTYQTISGGSGCTVSGTAGQAVYNSGSSGCLSSAATFSSGGGLTLPLAGAASTPGLTISGAPYIAGTTTTNFPQIYASVTGATAPTTLSATGTFFGANSGTGFTGNFLDFHVNGGASVFNVNSAGAIVGSGLDLSGTTASIINIGTSGVLKSGGTAFLSASGGSMFPSGFWGWGANGAAMSSTTPSATVPSVFVNWGASGTTGLGSGATNALDFISNGVDKARVTAEGIQYKQTTPPAITGTGSPTIATGGTDESGLVTAGASATSVIITFNLTHASTPFCVVNSLTQLAAFSYTLSNTAITITQTSTSGNKIAFRCTFP